MRSMASVKATILGFTVALLMIGAGALWTIQSTDNSALATLGPIVAGLGVALGYVTWRGRR